MGPKGTPSDQVQLLLEKLDLPFGRLQAASVDPITAVLFVLRSW